MPEMSHLGVGGVIFVVGAAIYIINMILGLARRRAIPFDGVGLMVLGIGAALLLRW